MDLPMKNSLICSIKYLFKEIVGQAGRDIRRQHDTVHDVNASHCCDNLRGYIYVF